ncbi:ADP,ATP carrier protein 1 [Astathelohania contejeani]|uniref:ADP,ATP carrier protein n=1 Tax=Astathelohania contejeani TaxID=164912 RepID=A0ABQ7I0R3_9MICR|nr:ADP,ATP carrier protein 1 [Thelohania contejeani]
MNEDNVTPIRNKENPLTSEEEYNTEEYTKLPTEEDVERAASTSRFFPIAKIERRKFWHMAIMFFCIALVYSVLRDLKDAVVIERLGPASIPPLKTFYVTPLSLFFVVVIQKCLTFTTSSRILSFVVLIFGIYYIIYACVILPFRDILEPGIFWSSDRFGDGKMSVRGLEFLYALAMTINAWTASLLYVTSELWGNLVLSLLFLSFSNDVCPPRQSLRFIPLFYMISNVGLMLSGCIMLGMCYSLDNNTYKFNSYVFQAIFLVAGILCLCIYGLQYRLEKKIINRPLYKIQGPTTKKTKVKVGFMEGFKTMFHSKLLLGICAIVIFYNMTTNMVESSYKSCLDVNARALNKAVSGHVMRRQAIQQLIISALVILFLMSPLSSLIQRGGWTFIALIPPVFALFACIGVFGAAYINTNSASWITLTLGIEETIGLICVSGFKILKYAAFDICKEAISVKINREYRARFKGIFDGLCGKLGKSGGGIVIQLLYAIFDVKDIRKVVVYLLVISVIFSGLWVISVIYLGGKYAQAVENNTDIDLDLKVTTKSKK